MLRRALTGALLLAITTPARAETQVWESMTVLARSGQDSGVAGWFDAHARRRNNSTLFILRPGLGYAFSTDLIVHVGYAYVPTVVEKGPDAREQRLWQHALWNHTWSPLVKTQVRGRLEQRFGAGDELGHRVRVLVRGVFQPSAEFPLQIVAQDEVFWQLNTTDWGPRSGFDQNRGFIGLGVETTLRGVRVEAGYLNVAFGDHLDHRVDHVAAMNLIVNLVPSD